MKPKNAKGRHDRALSSWFSDEMISHLYERNPLWRHAEGLAYSDQPAERPRNE